MVRNERLTLMAAALNSVAVAILAAGVILPTVGAAYGTFHFQQPWQVVLMFTWTVAGIGIHGLAQGDPRVSGTMNDPVLFAVLAPLVLLVVLAALTFLALRIFFS